MNKIRVTQHSGRGYGSKHNDRNFDVTKSDHIDASKSDQNEIYCCYDGVNFSDAELLYYDRTFSNALDRTNERYEKNYHPERMKSMSDWMMQKQKCPEEMILQIGNVHDDTDADALKMCAEEYLEYLMSWSETHNNAFTVLNAAIHVDEASPHAHVRRVWQYTDADGVTCIGQDKALEQAGVPLPDPFKPKGQKNNRKMTFDAMMREKWMSIVKSHGFDVETQPLPKAKHRKKGEYIQDEERKALDRLERSKMDLERVNADYKEKLRLDAERASKAEIERLGRVNTDYQEKLRSDVKSALDDEIERLKRVYAQQDEEREASFTKRVNAEVDKRESFKQRAEQLSSNIKKPKYQGFDLDNLFS